MNRELIEKLREDGKFLGGNFGKLMHEAADALEAKAAPVGEREAFEAWCAQEMGVPVDDVIGAEGDDLYAAFQAGAAHQRQQAREVVMPERMECEDGYPSDDWLRACAWNACLDEFARLNKGAGSHE